MEEAVSAADANRRFSRLLRAVREGHGFVVTSHGKAVARLVPAGRRDDVAKSAHALLLARLERQPVAATRRWTRDELYDEPGAEPGADG